MSSAQIQRMGLGDKYGAQNGIQMKEDGGIATRQFDTASVAKDLQGYRYHGLTGRENVRIIAGQVVPIIEDYRG
ncbi:hypothetical protein PWP93_21205 [Paraburkholderia sp. A1RI-2L]|uniref:hypothetical protein n=1 Tax=Paraburkholderia sp. A1RI-2L TaxID=3028367 RepID=UPI003B802FA3